MTVTELLTELTRQGVHVSADGDELTVRAPRGVLTPSLRAALARDKTEILARLRQPVNGESTALPQIVPAPQDRYLPFPLTDMQQAYWIGRTAALELGRVACQVYLEMESAGLKLPALNEAWQKLIARHDMLRAIVRPDGQQQILRDPPPYTFEILDLSGRDGAEVASELERIRREMSHRVTSPDQWPLFEIRASRLPSQRTRVHFRIELTVADARSVIFLLREWFQLYLDPGPALPPLELSFRDYVLAEMAAQDSEAYRTAERYWLGRVPTLPPAPDLPLAQNPASIQQPRFMRRSAELDRVRWQQLKTRAARAGLTPSGVLGAAFADILAAWSKSPDFNLNLTFFNRPPIHPQLKDIIGDFTSTILLEIHHSEPTFEARARRLQDQLQKDLEYCQYSGVRVLRELHRVRGGAITAIAPIVFTSGLSIRGGDESPADALGEMIYSISQTPQVWLDHQTFERAGALFTSWDSVDSLFPPGLLDDMFWAYCRLLDRLASDKGAWEESGCSVLPVEQLRQREAINDTTAPVPEQLLQALFEAQAGRQPLQPAVISSGRTLTYQELSQCAARLARHMRQAGARPNTLVAVVLEKGWEQVCAVLGILQSGAAYLPIDPDLPPERVAYLLENGGVEFAVTDSGVERKLAWPPRIQRFRVDDPDPSEGTVPTKPPVQQPTDLAYVIYTSGSTGLPKGVMIDHRGAVNTILDINQRFGVSAADRVLALSALSFDLSVYDIFGTLAAGGTIVIPDASESRNPAHWLHLLKEHRVTIWNSVPALLQMLVEFAAGSAEPLPSSLRLAMLSGDWIPVALPQQTRALAQGVHVISLGGATEASIWSILYPIREVDPAWKSIPYGRPMVNQRFHVLNSALEPCPVWVPGQLYIGGIGLAQGYWRDSAKTMTSFFIHPRTGERLYRTGDWGRYLPDGNIEFLGREDFQVKIGGHRVELGEIEAALTQHPAVRAGVVVAAGEPHGNRRLVAYVAADRPLPSFSTEAFPELKNVVLDPIARLEFKLAKPGLREPSAQGPSIALSQSAVDKAAYARRRSYRQFLAQPVSLEQLGELLGCLRHVSLEGVAAPKALYGSAGSLYPVQTYVYVKPGRIDGLAGGVYYYHPHDHSLVLLSPDARVASSVHVPANRAVFDVSAFSIFLIAQMKAIEPMYGEYSLRYATLEAGLMTQLLEMSAPVRSIGLCQLGGLDFARIREWFALDDGHILLHSLVGGGIDPRLMDEAALREPAVAVSPALTTEPALVENLRSFLSAKLPQYMVPPTIVLLDTLPLTPNGKADRKALLDMGTAPARTAQPYVAPRNELERTLASVVERVLHLGEVSVHQSFFELGASSLDLVQVHRELRSVLGRELPVVEIFRYPTIAAMAEYLGRSESTPSLPPDVSFEIDLSGEAVLDPEIIVRAPAVSAVEPSAVFLTGGTGFLGGYLLRELLEQTTAGVYCLVRAGDAEEAQARLEKKLESLSGQHSLARVKAIVGDLRRPFFGLSPAQYEALAESVDVIYHGGADVNFVRSYEALKPSTVSGTTEVLRLASHLRTKPVHHVSSLTVFGSPLYLGRAMIREDDPLADSRGLSTGYFQTKWVAERLVMAARERGIPASIYRPGQIACHSRTGDCKLDDLLPLLIRGCIQLGRAPRLGSLQFDLVPVDTVSRGIVHLSRRPELLGKAFNFVAPQPLTWDRMFDVIGSSGYEMSRVPYGDWLRALRHSPNDNALLPLLPFFEKLDAGLLKSVPMGSENLRRGLAGSEVSMPAPERLLELYLDNFVRIGFIPAPPRQERVP